MMQSAPLSSGFFGLNPFGVLVPDLIRMFNNTNKRKDLEKVWYNKRWNCEGTDRSLKQVLALDVSFLSDEKRMCLIDDLEWILGGMVRAQLVGYTFHVGYKDERHFLIARCVSIKPHEEACNLFNTYIQKRMNDFIDSDGNQCLVVLSEKIKISFNLLK